MRLFLLLAVLTQTKQVTFDAANARYTPTNLEVTADGGCVVTQCLEVQANGVNSVQACFSDRLRITANINTCRSIVAATHRRALSRGGFPVDGGE